MVSKESRFCALLASGRDSASPRAGCAFLVLSCALAGCSTVSIEQPDVEGPRVAEDVCEFERDPEPEGLSGISRIGGDRYFSVDDRGGILHELEIVQNEDGEIGSCTVKRSIRLEGRTDLEGCAYDPLDGRVWVSDEHDTSVRQFDPETGRETARVAVPEVFGKNIRRNRSFEGLTIAPDGYRMYVANEDTLACDGKPADAAAGGVVRIQEFVRAGKGARWMPTRQFRYRTDPVEGAGFRGTAISGVAGLCATGDGMLLVLEREMSQKNPLFPSFRGRLYEIGLDTDAIEPGKRLLWDEDTMFANYEGICLGPELKNGCRSLVLVSDGGGKAEERLLVLALSAGK